MTEKTQTQKNSVNKYIMNSRNVQALVKPKPYNTTHTAFRLK